MIKQCFLKHHIKLFYLFIGTKKDHPWVAKGGALGNYFNLLPSFPVTNLVSRPRIPNLTT